MIRTDDLQALARDLALFLAQSPAAELRTDRNREWFERRRELLARAVDAGLLPPSDDPRGKPE